MERLNKEMLLSNWQHWKQGCVDEYIQEFEGFKTKIRGLCIAYAYGVC